MSNNAINSLGYIGTVTLSLYTKDKKKTILKTLHNTGETDLFNFLADCILGDYKIADLSRPTKIMLLKHDDSSEDNKDTPKSEFIYTSTKQRKNVDSGNSASTVLSFILTRSAVLNSEFNRIGLYADNTDISAFSNYAAYCDVGSDLADASNWDSSAVLIIDWELNISNKTATN